MKKFDYCEFADNYGFMVDAKQFDMDEALEIAKSEMGLIDEPDSNFEISEEYIRYTINGGFEFDYQPCYQTCDKNAKGSFKCYKINYLGE